MSSALEGQPFTTILFEGTGSGDFDLNITSFTIDSVVPTFIDPPSQSYATDPVVDLQANLDRIFDWGESIFPNLLPENNDSQEVSGYYARLYSNGNAVGGKDDNIWFYDGNEITLVGSVDSFLSQADLGGF